MLLKVHVVAGSHTGQADLENTPVRGARLSQSVEQVMLDLGVVS